MLPRGDSPAPLNRVVAKELRMIGTFRFDRQYADAVDALIDGRIDVAPMLTHQYAFLTCSRPSPSRLTGAAR